MYIEHFLQLKRKQQHKFEFEFGNILKHHLYNVFSLKAKPDITVIYYA